MLEQVNLIARFLFCLHDYFCLSSQTVFFLILFGTIIQQCLSFVFANNILGFVTYN